MINYCIVINNKVLLLFILCGESIVVSTTIILLLRISILYLYLVYRFDLEETMAESPFVGGMAC